MSAEPHACSLPVVEQGARAAEFRALAASALVDRDRDDGAVRLSFRDEPSVREAVEDLARRERECCSFLDFRVEQRDGRVTLAIGARPRDRAALDPFYELAG
ncbi:MAG TPA: hypothetical protein VHG69_09115 [Thermoleophilaceae bacterium]|nr:hypothetical protein [Thermoleophilaceae bacterium]